MSYLGAQLCQPWFSRETNQQELCVRGGGDGVGVCVFTYFEVMVSLVSRTSVEQAGDLGKD
jgi:hypothetical protein